MSVVSSLQFFFPVPFIPPPVLLSSEGLLLLSIFSSICIIFFFFFYILQEIYPRSSSAISSAILACLFRRNGRAQLSAVGVRHRLFTVFSRFDWNLRCSRRTTVMLPEVPLERRLLPSFSEMCTVALAAASVEMEMPAKETVMPQAEFIRYNDNIEASQWCCHRCIRPVKHTLATSHRRKP